MTVPRTTVLRRAAITFTAGLLGLGSSLVVPHEAEAAAKCPNESGFLCFWTDRGFKGRMGMVEGPNTQWWTFQGGCSHGWDNCASAINNEGLNCEAVVYEDESFMGASWVINRDTSAGDLSKWPKPTGGNWDNAISSNSWWCG